MRATITISGNVQNVGFRASIQKAACKLGLVGEVANLEDGRVEVVCEGERGPVKRLIEILKEVSGLARIDSVSVSYSEPTGEFKLFKVAYGDMTKELVNATTAVVTQINSMNKNMTEGFRGVNNRLDSMTDEMRGVKEEVRGVNDRLDVMEKTAQEGFERVGA